MLLHSAFSHCSGIHRCTRTFFGLSIYLFLPRCLALLVCFVYQVKSAVERVKLHALELWVTSADATIDGGGTSKVRWISETFKFSVYTVGNSRDIVLRRKWCRLAGRGDSPNLKSMKADIKVKAQSRVHQLQLWSRVPPTFQIPPTSYLPNVLSCSRVLTKNIYMFSLRPLN